jgi:drug/metabolite transporter (DMT)-like permease
VTDETHQPVAESVPRDAAPASDEHGHDPLRGAAFMTLAVLFMVGIDSSANALVDRYPIHQVIFFRGAGALVPIAVMVAVWGGLKSLRVTSWTPHILRAVFSIAAMVAFFLALRFMTLADTTAIAMAAPLFITVLAIPILGETIGPYRWGAVCVGFVGVLVMLRPSPEGLADPVALLPLAAAFSYGMVQVVTRKYAAGETTQAYTAITSALVTAFVGAWCLFQPWVPLRWEDAPWIVGIGLSGTVMTVFLIMAYRAAEASFVSIFDYTILFWAILVGWLLFDEVPDPVTMGGAAIVIASGVFIVHRETVRARKGRS